MKSKFTICAFFLLVFYSMNFAQVTSLTVPSPANNFVGVSIVPTISGTIAGTVAASTNLIISTTSDFSSGNTTYTTATIPGLTEGASFSFTLTPAVQLANSTVYYWKIVDVAAYTSETFQFTTVSGAMPYLSNPYNGAVISGYTTTFAWNTGLVGLKYYLQIATDVLFTTAVPGIGTVDVANTTNTYYSVNNSVFASGTPAIYWRVIAKNIAGTVVYNYSNTWVFSTPGLPNCYPSYPTGNTTIYNNPPTCYWTLDTYNPKVTEYLVRYRTDDETYPALDAGGLALPETAAKGFFLTGSSNWFTTIPFALTPGTKYQWQVAAFDGGSVAAATFSDEQSFTLYGTATFLICYPSYPVGGITVTSNPTFYWYANAFAPTMYYKVIVSATSGGAPIADITEVTTNSLTLTNSQVTSLGLIPGNTYFWRVKGRFTPSGTYGPESAEGSFIFPASSNTTVSVATPYPSSPSSGSVVPVTNPTLGWYAYSTDPIQFQVIYTTDPAFGSAPLSNVFGNILISGVMTAVTTPILDSRPLINSTSFVLSGLTPGATYYWQVRAKSVTSGTFGPWSSISWFTTAPGAASVVPLAGSPINGTSINNTSATLSWILPAKSSASLKYDIQYSKKADFSNAVTIGNLDKTNVEIKNLDKSTTYYWRASSSTNNGFTSSYSAATSFNTGAATDVEENNELPTQFELSQNYPNPFNPTTVISYQISANSFVTLKIYDMLGREVKTLVNKDMSAGKYNMNWNGDDSFGNKVASGTYIYRITADNFVSSKKMVLIK